MNLIPTMILVAVYFLLFRIIIGWVFHDIDKEAMFTASLAYITLLIHIIRKK